MLLAIGIEDELRVTSSVLAQASDKTVDMMLASLTRRCTAGLKGTDNEEAVFLGQGDAGGLHRAYCTIGPRKPAELTRTAQASSSSVRVASGLRERLPKSGLPGFPSLSRVSRT